ncbi:MAG: TonB family protein [Acidobacteriota bacterium]
MRFCAPWVLLPTLFAAQDSGPARLIQGPVSIAMPRLHGQCLATLDVIVGDDGTVEHVRPLYGSIPLTDELAEAVEDWEFRPALDQGEPYASHVLVAGLYRPLTLYDLGPCGPPDQVERAPPSLPVPVVTTAPVYSARARGGGVVTVEVEIGQEGEVRSTRAVGGRTAFDAAAERAARAWRFRLGRQPAPIWAYLVFGFQEPVLAPRSESP